MPLEIACFTPESAILAARAGADRIELCADRQTGGMTPSLRVLKRIVEELGDEKPPIYVMIRVNPSLEFKATDEELEEMTRQMEELKPFAQGFVFGLLDSDRSVDIASNKRLLSVASPLPCTFHRAIDVTPNPVGALDIVMSLGFSSILTSGTADTALAGRATLERLVKRAGGKLQVIAGGGVRSVDVEEIRRETGVEWVHSSGITGGQAGEEVDVEEVKRLRKALGKV